MIGKTGVTGNRLWSGGAALLLAVALAGCGQDLSPADPSAEPENAGTQYLKAIPADAGVNGAWSDVYAWPLIPLHAVMLPDGRVLSYGSSPEGYADGYHIYDVWNPAQGTGGSSHTTLPNNTGTDLFCASQVGLPEGQGVLINGGDNWNVNNNTHNSTGNPDSNIFDPANNQLTTTNHKMHLGRWYGTSTIMLDGEVYVQGGISGEANGEVRRLDGTFDLMSGYSTSNLRYYYPRNYVIGPHKLFGFDTIGLMYYIDTAANNDTGSLTMVGSFDNSYDGDDGSSVMFRPRRILQMAGNSSKALTIDVRDAGTPVVKPTSSLSSQRRRLTSTLLPNGQVLVTGGSEVEQQLIGVNNHAETWNPVTGQWRLGSEGALARLYHSIAMLMPDGTVLVGGGGAPGPLNNTNVEIYSPSYLFTADGKRATRPRIVTAPDNLQAGKVFTMRYSSTATIARVTMIKAAAVTHGFNQEQRFIDLPFTVAGTRLTVRMPSRPSDIPPGNWYLHVLDNQGVPSVAKRVWIATKQAPDADHSPVITNPGDLTNDAGDDISVTVHAADPDGGTITYSAAGLPAGLSINSANGKITGKPAHIGTYDVVVGADDGTNTTSENFLWTIGGEEPLTIEPLPPSSPTPAGTTVFYTAQANGSNTQYRWNFGDGSPTTTLSDSGSISHGFENPGIYFVTVSAVDDQGGTTNQTFVQAVYLPATANKPTQSSTIVTEPRGTGAGRIWIVNQDQDSVSAFDGTDGTRLVEIPVGSAPRNAALSGTKLWVTNKRGDSVSVIDTNTFNVVKTIALPRASQPHGIAMSPNGQYAYIALEGTGKLLRYKVSDYSLAGSADVGLRPRGVSIVANGSTAYVSRFVTPPQPGESTATVSNTLDGKFVGGEVVRVTTSTMTVAGTTILRHSLKPDFEMQGRGVPNYLGAMAISPDGTQGFVPSKQDNIMRGALRDGKPLNFQNTVRAIVSKVKLSNGTEEAASRVDLDNSSLASAAVFDPLGVYLFVALETSREVAILDAHGHRELLRIQVGRAPEGLTVSADGETLFVDNFMSRTVGLVDLRPLRLAGEVRAPGIGNWTASATEKLSAKILSGKQTFYDARDVRLSRDRYMSCATCHDDGDQDGRVWDFTSLGEGLRNTIALRGRAGGQGFLHWSNNFDEVQDFEQQFRNLTGGQGLMSDDDFFQGTRSQPLGDPKAGISPELDALAAYVKSLSRFDASPFRANAATLTADAIAGKTIFKNKGCQRCHAGAAFTGSGANTLVDIGTLKPSSGNRSGGPLTGIDVPTLRDVWETAPYLHDGSAATIGDAILAHDGVTMSAADLAKLVAFVQQIGREEPAVLPAAVGGNGLKGEYFNSVDLSGSPVLTRTEAPDFAWSGSPGAGVNADQFTVRWSGQVKTPSNGSYVFQTITNDGVRLYVDGNLVIDRWSANNKITSTTGPINFPANKLVTIVMEFREKTGPAEAHLKWKAPGNPNIIVIPQDRLLSP